MPISKICFQGGFHRLYHFFISKLYLKYFILDKSQGCYLVSMFCIKKNAYCKSDKNRKSIVSNTMCSGFYYETYIRISPYNLLLGRILQILQFFHHFFILFYLSVHVLYQTEYTCIMTTFVSRVDLTALFGQMYSSCSSLLVDLG